MGIVYGLFISAAGAIAMIGTALDETAIGNNDNREVSEKWNRVLRRVEIIKLMIKPSTEAYKVLKLSFSRSENLNNVTLAILLGEGNNNREISNDCTTISHITNKSKMDIVG